MIQLDFRSKANGVPILSKDIIEYCAEMIIHDYKPSMLKGPATLDVEDFSEFYAGLEIDYKDLTHNQSILGMMVFNDCCIPVYDAERNKARKISVNEGTILIDNSLLEQDQLMRGRFTLCHEVSHWLLHRQMYMVDKNQISLFDYIEEQRQPVIKCRTADIESTGRKRLVTDEDWIEWQADYMASALLMPKNAFSKVVREKFNSSGMESGYYQIGTDFEKDLWVEVMAYELADLFEVSVAAARIRLKNLGFVREESRQFSLELNH